jgi:hypothetical protein
VFGEVGARTPDLLLPDVVRSNCDQADWQKARSEAPLQPSWERDWAGQALWISPCHGLAPGGSLGRRLLAGQRLVNRSGTKGGLSLTSCCAPPGARCCPLDYEQEAMRTRLSTCRAYTLSVCSRV